MEDKDALVLALAGLLALFGSGLVTLTFSFRALTKLPIWLLALIEMAGIAGIVVGASLVVEMRARLSLEASYAQLLEPRTLDIPLLKRVLECQKEPPLTYEKFSRKFWISQARKLGLDLSKELDKTLFSVWLFYHYGARPWLSNIECWGEQR